MELTKNQISALDEFIKKHKLVVAFDDGKYPMLEAWTYLGNLLGITPRIDDVSDPTSFFAKSDNQTLQYTAKCTLIGPNGLIGGGVGVCGNDEPDKKEWLSHNLCSMAETRAVSKAFRLMFGWVMLELGYSSTTAEEMEIFRPAKEQYKSPEKPKETKPTAKDKPESTPEKSSEPKEKDSKPKEGSGITNKTRLKTEVFILIGNEVFKEEERAEMTLKASVASTEDLEEMKKKLEAHIKGRKMKKATA